MTADVRRFKAGLTLGFLLLYCCLVPMPPSIHAQDPVLDVTLTVHNPQTVARHGEPVTAGLPIPRAANLVDLRALRLADADGQPVAVQFTPLARWGGAPDDVDRPVRWLLLDFQAEVDADSETVYHLVASGGEPPAYPPLEVTDGPDAVTINTGAAVFRIRKDDGLLAAPHLAAPLTGTARAADGTTYTTTGPATVSVTLRGPMRAAVTVRGAYRNASGEPLLDHTSRYWFYAGLPTVRLFHTVENNTPCPLRQDEQIDCHPIGSEGSINLADLSLALPTSLGGNLVYQAGGEGRAVSGELTDHLLVHQDSSGTDYWDCYLTLQDWDGHALDARPRMQAYVTFRGYRTTLGGTLIDSGDHAAGWLTVSGTSGTWSAGVRDFWQNFPKTLRVSPDGTLQIGLFPDEFGPDDYRFNLRAGEHKTHEIWLSPSGSLPVFWSPLFAQAPPEWYVSSGGLGFLAPPDNADWPEYDDYVRYQLDTSPAYDAGYMNWHPNLLAAIARTDFYGIFDYGDWPIDYEGFGVAPLNIKYDYDYGLWLQWARSGDRRWFELAEAADRHAADIDILHTRHEPRHWSDGVAFGHSYHDEPGFTNPHRNEGGTHPDVAFGLPGMLLTYYFTGYDKAYQSALELADCIEYRLHNDWALCDFFPSGECNGQGYALDAAGLYGTGSRPAANNLSMAVAAYRATGDPRYLAVADAVVNWARPADQPYINGPTGEDEAIRPWTLNMYLRALASYLEMRGEFGLPDTYDAGAAYLAYADWLRTYAVIDLEPLDLGPGAAYPYEWWFDGRQGDPHDEWAVGNNVPSINNWLLLGADAMAYAYHLSGNIDYLELAARLFRTGSHDPFYLDDANTYSSTKETINGITFGHVFLHEWAGH